VLVRYAGVNDAVGREVFTAAGIEYYGEEITMTMAAKKMVEKMRQTYPGAEDSQAAHGA
jgi:succinyl-CoA synthetase beta subunit/citryl-CoA synthetase large subunit